MMQRPPKSADVSPEAKARRAAAVWRAACPKCGAKKGQLCRTPRGGTYDPNFTVHSARFQKR